MQILSLVTIGAATLTAQAVPACQPRALKTVQTAKSRALAGDKQESEKLLEQADHECGASYAVLKGISEVFGQLGEQHLADLYIRNANRYQQQKPGAAVSANGPAATGEEKGFVRDKFALIVGVGRFREANIPPLKFAAKDAADFAVALTNPDIGRFPRQNVTVLSDQEATTKAIRSALADIAKRAMKDDLVVLYFSTHGSSPSMDRSKIGSGYLVTHDTEVADLYATAYGMDELANFMRQKIRAERIVTFLDTCYSGDTTRILQQTGGSKGLEVEALTDQSIGQIAQSKGSVVITSSNNRELSWESDERQNSFFTLYLMESMAERKGLSNVKQLYTDLQRKLPPAVRDYTRSKKLGSGGKGATQNPVIYPMSDIPDIVIGVPVK